MNSNLYWVCLAKLKDKKVKLTAVRLDVLEYLCKNSTQYVSAMEICYHYPEFYHCSIMNVFNKFVEAGIAEMKKDFNSIKVIKLKEIEHETM